METKKLSQLEVLESAEGTHVLVEQDGTHKRVPAAKIGGNGSASIDVTASVGQTIVVTEVDANGKPTKWEAAEYQEKICGTELGYIIPETTVNYADEDPENDGQFVVDKLLVPGETYVVNWNGIDYTCVCKEGNLDGATIQAIGNAILLGGEDTGEPFGIFTTIFEGSKGGGVFPVDESVTSFTLSVKGNVAIPIPVQYLSNAVPHYIDVTAAGDGTLSIAETATELWALISSGWPMIARVAERDDVNGVTSISHIPLLSCAHHDNGGKTLFFHSRIGNATSYYVNITISADGTVLVGNGN